MEGRPLASAVIITYNQERYIEQTIECALAQKVDFDYEIVIGEDCSTDRTRDICLRYQERYPNIIRVIVSEENVGMLDNWYRTVSSARGKYIAGCGGDDFWHNPEKLQKQVRFLEQNPEYGMVHSEADFYFQGKDCLVRNYYASKGYTQDDSSDGILNRLVEGAYLVAACTAVHRKLLFDRFFKIDEFKRRGFQMEDTPLWAEIMVHSKVKYMTESLATYRVLEESTTQSNDRRRKLKFWLSNTDMCLYICERHGLPAQTREGLEKNWCRMALQLAFLERRRDLAEAARTKCSKLSLKNKVWYWGTKYGIARPLVSFLRMIFKKL